MTRRRSLLVAAALAGLVLSTSPGQASVGELDGDPAPPVTPSFEAQELRVEPPIGTFVGIDGQTYVSAPQVVDGLGGELFYGPDFDVACGVGAGYIRSMTAMTKLARTIERSGRRAVWIGAPSKTSVLYDQLNLAELPHGRCDRRGMAEQSQLIDSYDDPNFLDLRAKLAADPRQVYWRTDPHWTSVGGAVFAKTLARSLDPKLGRRQHYTLGLETRLGLFNIWRDLDDPETLQTAVPRTSVESRTTRRSVESFEAYPDIVIDHSWKSSPARRTWPGQTLLLGDSMTVFALENLRPIFRQGRFLWVEHVELDDVVAAIVDADTVILEVLQTFLPLSQILASKELRRAVATALRRERR